MGKKNPEPEQRPAQPTVIELLEKVLSRLDTVDNRLDLAEELQQELNTLVLASRSELRDIRSDQKDQDALLNEILDTLAPVSTGFDLTQINGGSMASKAKGVLTGVQVGASGTFQESPLPVGSLGLQTGTVPTYSVDDPLVTLSASPDGDPTKVVAAVAATDTGASFNMTVSGTNTTGTAISSVFNIAILPGTTPPPVVSTGFDLNQLS
jgi:hypothetical protein